LSPAVFWKCKANSNKRKRSGKKFTKIIPFCRSWLEDLGKI